MNSAASIIRRAMASAGVLAVAFLWTGCGQSSPPSAPPAGTNAAAGAKTAAKPAAGKPADMTQFASVFDDVLPPAGRDPFFPNSTRRMPKAPVVHPKTPGATPAEDLILKGIVGTGTHRLAVINNEILEPGETSANVHVGDTKIKLKVVEIG